MNALKFLGIGIVAVMLFNLMLRCLNATEREKFLSNAIVISTVLGGTLALMLATLH